MADRSLRLAPPTSPSPSFDPPRGRLIQAESIITRHYTDAETGQALVSPRWVRDNMPYKQKLSHCRVAWYSGDVDEIVAISRRDRLFVKDVKLDYLEKKAG